MGYRRPERQLSGSCLDKRQQAIRIKAEEDLKASTKELVKALFKTGRSSFWEAVEALPKSTMERLWGRSSVTVARDIFTRRRSE